MATEFPVEPGNPTKSGNPAQPERCMEPERLYAGEALSWHLNEDTLEVELHRKPCNEIGTTALRELEALADVVRQGAHGARALLWHSSVTRGFSAGADLQELYHGLMDGGLPPDGLAADARKLAEVRSFLDRIHDAFNAFDQAPLVTVGAVRGVCFGGGFELALTCDVLVAEQNARFAFPELRLGLVPGFGGVPRLRRDVGNAAIRDLLLTGRSIRASRAHALGLVSQVVGNGEALGIARMVAQQAARFDAQTTCKAKRFIKTLPASELRQEKDLFIELLASPTVARALKKFVESKDLRPYLP